MRVQIGVVNYSRPDYAVRHSDVEEVLAVDGKEVIRLAWNALAPLKCKHYKPNSSCSRGPYGSRFCTRQIERDDLASWFCQFFNLERDCGQGNACIDQLVSSGLLESACCASYIGIFRDEYYSAHCAPTFAL